MTRDVIDYGTGMPIVFVASWALASDMWEYQVPFFVEHGHHCVVLDRRGHEPSSPPTWATTSLPR
jgi:non-heme chloroperoxidase